MLHRLGAGGGGTVWLADKSLIDRKCALKVLHTEDCTLRTKFLEEAQVAARLDHPNVVKVVEYDTFEGGVFYEMEWIPGPDAAKVIETINGMPGKPPTIPDCLRELDCKEKGIDRDLQELIETPGSTYYHLVAWWIAGVAQGLHQAHETGIYHYDVKPGNLLLDRRNGRLKLTDFGLASMGERDQRRVGREGTPRYLAPERLAEWAYPEGEPTQSRSPDLWALGATLYEFLAFRHVYGGEHVADVLREIATTDPLELDKLAAQAPRGLKDICMRALERAPTHRTRSAELLSQQLENWRRQSLAKPARSGGLWRALFGGERDR